jgi:hypothetical protein
MSEAPQGRETRKFSHAISRSVEVKEIDWSHQYLVGGKRHHAGFIKQSVLGMVEV